MSNNTTEQLDPSITYYVKLPQNSRKNIGITINKDDLSDETLKNPSHEFKRLIKHTIIAMNVAGGDQMIHAGHFIKYTPETIVCYVTLFQIPKNLLKQLDNHFKKNGTIRFIKFCIGKQWMVDGTKIELSVLNGIPDITDLAIVNTTGECAPYCSNTYDLLNPEW